MTGSGRLIFDRDVDPRSARQLKLRLANTDYFGLYEVACIVSCLMGAASDSHAISIEAPRDAGANNFLSRLGFDDFVREVAGLDCMLPVIGHQDVSDVLVPLNVIHSSSDLQPIQDLLETRLSGVKLAQARVALTEALWELGANVTEHAKASGVAAAVVQRANRKGEHVDLAICDAGIGLRESFLRGSRRYHPATDHEAIELAIKYLVSSSGEQGRGQGLATVIEETTGLSGQVIVRSGSGRRTLSRDYSVKDALKVAHMAASVPRVRGTVVYVRVPCG